MTPDLTPTELAAIRAAAARYRMDGAGPQMLEALRKCEAALTYLIGAFEPKGPMRKHCDLALESARAAIAAAE